MWTIHMPVLSTGHITYETSQMLHAAHEAPGDFPGVTLCAEYSEGFFILIDGTEHLPDDLASILAWMMAQGFDDNWVRLDSDGDQVDLPVYDWEAGK
ncbi:hypothetical protein [Cupriavidus basilensis]|uniref:DUF5983 family protein n=1 Tax=Cupriavidus basilensis TaxID=68895 RepID=UPI0020A67168|nr:hypothetical protein [Cupriavidus basilensis]MCP3024982.1 hypothetical protein [Cupriavidus basilensis]